MEFSLETVAKQSEMNAVATILAVLAYLKQKNLAGADWVAFMGMTFGASWEPIRGAGPARALELVALDMRSVGAEILNVSQDADRSAEAVFGNWPDPALLAAFDLSESEAAEFMEVFAFLAAHIGLGFSARLEPAKLKNTQAKGTSPVTSSEIKVKLWQL